MYKSPLSISFVRYSNRSGHSSEQAQYKVAGKRDELAVLKTEGGPSRSYGDPTPDAGGGR